MAKILTLNTDNLRTGNSVEAHRPDCQHVARYSRHPFFEGGYVEEAETTQEIFQSYNIDFYDEETDDSTECWPITFYPCTGLVTTKTVVREWVKF